MMMMMAVAVVMMITMVTMIIVVLMMMMMTTTTTCWLLMKRMIVHMSFNVLGLRPALKKYLLKPDSECKINKSFSHMKRAKNS